MSGNVTDTDTVTLEYKEDTQSLSLHIKSRGHILIVDNA